MAVAIPGLIGSGDWSSDERPLNWRQGVLRMYPNGDAPLTAILSKFRNESVNDPEFNWWTKSLETQLVDCALYTDVGLSKAYGSGAKNDTTGAAAGTMLYAKVAAADVVHFIPGQQVLLRNPEVAFVTVVGKVTAVVTNGASSYVAVYLLEADDNGYGYNPRYSTYRSWLFGAWNGSAVNDCTPTIQVAGSIHPEGGEMPGAVTYRPTKYSNYTQIFRSAVEITRTARKTALRTYDPYAEAKREALEYHSIDIERALLWGVKTERTGANGKPERTTMGYVTFMRTYAPNNVVDFKFDTTSTGTWASLGYDWLNEKLEFLFRYGSTDKFVLCGNEALMGINALAKSNSSIYIEPGLSLYGMNVRRWVTPFGNLILKTHPLFNTDAVMRKALVIMELQNLRTRYIDDTMFKPDDRTNKGGTGQIDGTREEWLTELGLEFHFPETGMLLYNVGQAAANVA